MKGYEPLQKLNGSSGIRTHEAEALHLKCNPFDRSGILPFGDPGENWTLYFCLEDGKL